MIGERTTTKRYEVKDPHGDVRAVHHREEKPGGGKKCSWQLPGAHPDHFGLKGMPVADLPLYGSEHVAGWDEDDLIVLVEGEKPADALLDSGINALGTVTGASSVPGPEALAVLRDRVVCVWGDGDEPGRKHARRLAEALQGVACEVSMFTWHGAPEDVKGPDAADHPAVLSGDPKALDLLLNDLSCAPRWEPPSKPREAKNEDPGTFSAADLMDEELPPARFVVPGILPEGVTLLAGKPKLGKSWAALGMCVAVATGGVAFGKVPVDRGEALYLALEDNKRRLQKRLGKVLVGGAAPKGLHMATSWPKLDQGGIDKLDGWLTAHPNARLVVIDTLAKVRPEQRGNNVYREDYAALEALLPLAAEHGVAIVVVHHARKMSATDPMDEISGSTGLVGGVDGWMLMRRGSEQADVVLHVDGRDVEEPAELALRWDRNAAGWTILGEAAEYRMSEERRDVIRVLREADGPLGPKAVAEKLGRPGSYGAIRELMSQMASSGDLRKTGRGKYTTPDNADNADTLPNQEEDTDIPDNADIPPDEDDPFVRDVSNVRTLPEDDGPWWDADSLPNEPLSEAEEQALYDAPPLREEAGVM